ncbi:MAG: MFS transporter [Bacteroidetes bacterium]|nr:MFS transporter [Bacteroidota bacterium]
MLNELKNRRVGMLVLVAALGYFVDIYDLVLFGMERTNSLNDILGATLKGDELKTAVKNTGISLLNIQMIGMLVGGIAWGIIGDKKGRLSVLFGSIITYSVANILNGMVEDTTTYALLRFVSGFGLAGELGAGITLVSESMSKENRGWGTMLVASVGLCGAVVAGYVGEFIDNWRWSYYIGGGMGLLLLLLRIGVYESGMFSEMKQSDVKRGDFLMLFRSWKQLAKYFNVILVALPVWYVMGILITFCPEMGRAMGMPDDQLPVPREAIKYAYIGITIGDVASGWLSQVLRSRKKSLAVFLSLTVLCVVFYFLAAAKSQTMFYIVCGVIGFATGFWAVFMSAASELFGTNIRSTVTTTAPNFVRGGTVLLTFLFQFFGTGLTFSLGLNNVTSAIITGVITFTVAFIALWKLEETYGKDLNYTEQ